MSKPLRCRLHLHRWYVTSAEDGTTRFRRCSGCGKEDMEERPHWTAAPWGG